MEKKKFAGMMLALLMFSTLALAFNIQSCKGSAQSEEMRIEPSYMEVCINITFTVNITLVNVVNMWGWAATITWNNKTVNCTDVIQGPFNPAGTGLLFYIDNVGGTIARLAAGTTKEKTVTGSGLVCSLNFTTKALGDVNLNVTAADYEDYPTQVIHDIPVTQQANIISVRYKSSTRYVWSMFHHDLSHTGYTESPAPNTNQTQWKYITGGAVKSSSAIVDGRVYIGSDDGKVYCLNASTGKEIWNYTTGASVTSSPAIADGILFIGSNDRHVYALNQYTGRQIWNFTTGGWVTSSPAVADGKVYIGSVDGRVYALDQYTGAQIWSFVTGNIVEACPAVVNGKVYVGSYNRVYCLNASSGAPIWNFITGDWVRSSTAVVDGKVFVGSHDHKVYALNASTGALIWSYLTGGWVVSSPAVVDGRVYVGSNDTKTYCLDASSGAPIWNYTTGDMVLSSPAVACGKVYIGSKDSKVYCLNASTGTRIWSYLTGGWVVSSSAIADGMVFIGSDDYVVYAFGNIVKSEDYPTVQEAINAAPSGATVIIEPGVYHGSLVINKTLTIIGLKGSSTVFDGGGSGIAVILLPSASGSIIAGVVITNWNQGVLIINSSTCKIYDNMMSQMSCNGIALEGSNAANNRIYNNIFQNNAIAINLTASSTNNIIYHNSFVDNTVPIYVSMVAANTWDDGYPSGGNYWSTHISIDVNHGPLQNEIGSDGIVDINYTIAVNNVDRYPLVKPFSPHDIGITSVTTSKTVIGQGSTPYISVKILNYGLYDETFTITIRANAFVIAMQTITLTKRNSITLNLTWNTASFAKSTYTISVVVDTVPDETDATDNTYTYGSVTITWLGDLTDKDHLTPPGGVPDGKVDENDLWYFCSAFIDYYKIPRRLDVNCDFDNNNKIDEYDLWTFCGAYIDYWKAH